MYDWQSYGGFSLSFQVLYNEILCSDILSLISDRCFQIIPLSGVIPSSVNI